MKSATYKPACKENSKTAKNRPQNLPDDLAEIVALLPDLPEHIKRVERNVRQVK